MRESLRDIAREAVEISEAGHYRRSDGSLVDISRNIATAIAGTRCYLPEDPVSVEAGTQINNAPLIEVTAESTLEAAQRVNGEGAASLIFASATKPGGGFLNGAQAQEESIARSSALYVCLRTAPEYYTFHKSQRDLRYSDRVIYSPSVPVFRDDNGKLLDDPYTTAMLTVAAPNLGAILDNQPHHAASVPEVLQRRASRLLEIAAAHGHRTLVLGAWGCGVFRNDPATVASAFAEALRTVNRFDHVVFAIYGKAPGYAARQAFEEMLA